LGAWTDEPLQVHLESFKREPPVGQPPWCVKATSVEANPGGSWVVSIPAAGYGIPAQKMSMNFIHCSREACGCALSFFSWKMGVLMRSGILGLLKANKWLLHPP